MILPFSQELNGKPTLFPQKIWKGLNLGIGNYQINYQTRKKWMDKCNSRIDLFEKIWIYDLKPKIHTIRKDEKNRWKAGNKIHLAINNRTPNYFQFAPTLECKGIQDFEIIYVKASNNYNQFPIVAIDGWQLPTPHIIELAENDGFDNVHDFLDYFNEDFKGKIIHWTDYKYDDHINPDERKYSIGCTDEEV